MAPVDSGIVVSHSGTTYGDGRGIVTRDAAEGRDKRTHEARDRTSDTRRVVREQRAVNGESRAIRYGRATSRVSVLRGGYMQSLDSRNGSSLPFASLDRAPTVRCVGPVVRARVCFCMCSSCNVR